MKAIQLLVLMCLVSVTSQAAAYEMIGAAGDILSGLGEKLGLISGQSRSAQVLQKKLEAESSCIKIDELTLELMKAVDGVNCNISDAKGVKYKPENRFAKRLFSGSMSAQTARMRYLDDYSRITSLICNGPETLELLHEAVLNYSDRKRDEEELEKELENTKDPDERRSIYEYLSKIRKKTDKYKKECDKLSKEVRQACTDSQQKISEALDCLDRIQIACNDALPKVGEYEAVLSGSVGELGQDELNGHNETLTGMKRYLADGTSPAGINYASARADLENNLNILKNCDYSSKLYFASMSSEEALKWSEEVEEVRAALYGISYGNLMFDYSGFAEKKEDTGIDAAFCQNLMGSFGESLFKLALPEGTEVSEAGLDTALLPSGLLETFMEDVRNEKNGFYEAEDANDGAEGMAGVIGNSALEDVSGIDGSGLETAFNDEEAGDEEENNEAQGGNTAKDKALTVLYMHDHFACFTDQVNAGDTVMKYEQEYIACGKDTDRENLAFFLTEVLMLRMVSAMLYIMSDKTVTAKAEAAALLAVGFTGLPFLIKAVEYLILFVWAYEQAMIELAALAMGKKISSVTGREGFCLDIKELTAFSSAMVRQKAANLPEPSRGIGYGEYLMIFIMLNKHRTACYRAMDLVQENIRYEYDDNFLLSNCIDRFTAKAIFSTRYAFIGGGGYQIVEEHPVRY